jgi:hypothetical protein
VRPSIEEPKEARTSVKGEIFRIDSDGSFEGTKPFIGMKRDGAEGESRTRTSVTSTVFETAASTIPPLRHAKECNYKDG